MAKQLAKHVGVAKEKPTLKGTITFQCRR